MDSTLIQRLVTPIVAKAGLEIDRVEVLPAGKRKVVRIFLDGDGPAGRGPSLDEIAEATKAISRRLDEAAELGNNPYTLEVSSRGVSRPLTEAKHFRRNLGRLVEVDLGSGRTLGRIGAVEGDRITLDSEDGQVEVDLADVRRAVVQVELSRSADDADDADDELTDQADEDKEE